MAYFDGVYKSTKDFFKKSFSRDNKVEVSAKADNGVKMTLEGGVVTSVKQDKTTKTESVKKTGATSIKVDYKTSPVSLDKFEVASSGTVKADVSLPDLVAGSKVTFQLEDGSRVAQSSISGKFGFETTQQVGVQAGVKGHFDAVQGTGAFSLLLKQQGFLLGANTGFTTPLAAAAAPAEKKAAPAPAPAAGAEGGDKPKATGSAFGLTEYDFLVGYTTGAATFGVQTGKKATTATAFAHAAVTPQVTVAGQATAPLSKGGKGITVSVGGSYKVDKDVTLFGAVDDKAVVRGAAALAVAPKATLTVYGELNALKIEEDGKHFFGTKLALRA